MPRIGSVNREALAQGRPVLSRFDASSQILLIAACPLSGPIAGLTGWAMTRVVTFAGDSYRLLMAGIGVLLAAVLGAAHAPHPIDVELVAPCRAHRSGAKDA